MAESKLVQLNIENSSYNVCSIIFMHLVAMLSLCYILISDLVAADLLMHSLPGMILAMPLYTKGDFACDWRIQLHFTSVVVTSLGVNTPTHTCTHMCTHTHTHTNTHETHQYCRQQQFQETSTVPTHRLVHPWF